MVVFNQSGALDVREVVFSGAASLVLFLDMASSKRQEECATEKRIGEGVKRLPCG